MNFRFNGIRQWIIPLAAINLSWALTITLEALVRLYVSKLGHLAEG